MLQKHIERCGKAAKDNGWHDYYHQLLPETPEARDHVITKLALISSEVSEAIEEIRKGVPLKDVYYSEGNKPEGFSTELVDILIRTFDLAYMLGVSLDTIYEEKLKFNESRGYKHGKEV